MSRNPLAKAELVARISLLIPNRLIDHCARKTSLAWRQEQIVSFALNEIAKKVASIDDQRCDMRIGARAC